MTTPVDTLRRFYDALGRGDVPSVVSLLDAQVALIEICSIFLIGADLQVRADL
jgi:uncharacterized membrane protein